MLTGQRATKVLGKTNAVYDAVACPRACKSDTYTYRYVFAADPKPTLLLYSVAAA